MYDKFPPSPLKARSASRHSEFIEEWYWLAPSFDKLRMTAWKFVVHPTNICFMRPDDGYIKFNLQWHKAAALGHSDTAEIVRYRNICFNKKYIGVSEGVGYGNISARYHAGNQFIISGTQTGGLKKLTARHFTLVTSVDLKKNSVTCAGPVCASAESLTHAMFYALDKNIFCVIHIHHGAMWERLLHQVPTTEGDVPYGTVAMCQEVARLYRASDLRKKKILAMAGHREGIISFGKNLQEALDTLDAHHLIA